MHRQARSHRPRASLGSCSAQQRGKAKCVKFAEHQRLGALLPQGSGTVQAGMPQPGKVNVDAAACAGWKHQGQPGHWGQSDTGLGAAGKMQ